MSKKTMYIKTIGISKDHQIRNNCKDGHSSFLENPENFNFKVNMNKGHLDIRPRYPWVKRRMSKLSKKEQLQIKRKLKDCYLSENPTIHLELKTAKDAQDHKRERRHDAMNKHLAM